MSELKVPTYQVSARLPVFHDGQTVVVREFFGLRVPRDQLEAVLSVLSLNEAEWISVELEGREKRAPWGR